MIFVFIIITCLFVIVKRNSVSVCLGSERVNNHLKFFVKYKNVNRESKKSEMNNSKLPSINSQLNVAYLVFQVEFLPFGCIVATIQQFTNRLDNYSWDSIENSICNLSPVNLIDFRSWHLKWRNYSSSKTSEWMMYFSLFWIY